ncbi:MAG: GerMN domain-containing protein [Agrococcus casei]|uniref:GerMN domain-containing protein n=2 Tax=Agrococcus casei TaxID=343512 RepID=UPI003F9961D8
MRRRTLSATLAVLAVIATAVGCVRIPDSGPVTAADPTEVVEAAGVEFIAEPPAEGASPEAIILGFLFAGVSPEDDYAVAREFMTPQAAAAWNPDAQVQVRSGQPQVSMTGESTGEVAVTLSSRVNSRGLMNEAVEQTSILNFSLEQVDGEWRLASLPDGVLVSSFHFERLYRAQPVQWFTLDGGYMVPDNRWFRISDASLDEQVIEALLAGPATWLESSVVSAAAPGATLQGSVSDRPGGGLSMTLDVASPQSATWQELSRFALQVKNSLIGTGVGAVEVRVAGGTAVGLSTEAEPVDESVLWHEPLMFADGVLRAAETDGEIVPDIGSQLDDLGATAFTPIPGAETVQAGAVQSGGEISWLSDGATTEITAKASTTPSVDRHGAVWWIDDGDSPGIHTWMDGVENTFLMDLEGQRASAMQVSPDGTRLAVATRTEGATTVHLFSVVRAAGEPTSVVLGPTITPTAGTALDLEWTSLSSMALLTTDAGVTQVSILGLDGSVTGLVSPADPIADIAASGTTNGVVALTGSGSIYSMSPGSVVRFAAVSEAEFLVS